MTPVRASTSLYPAYPSTCNVPLNPASSRFGCACARLIAKSNVTACHSRPHVSDDNPYSKSQFKALKYRPDFPDRFGCIGRVRTHCQTFFAWYNTMQRHSGIGFMTPESIHYGRAQALVSVRQTTLDAAFVANPMRFKGQRPQPPALPTAAWISP